MTDKYPIRDYADDDERKAWNQPFEARPTRFVTVATICAAVALVAAVLAIVLMGGR